MFILISASDSRPVYEQIADAIKRQLWEKELHYGDELPSVRAMANMLSVNMHTVRHAYRILAEEGIIVMRLGRKTRISPPPDKKNLSREAQEFILEKWRRLEQEAFLHGLSSDELLSLVRNHVEGCGGKENA